jgi:hypothetical protein
MGAVNPNQEDVMKARLFRLSMTLGTVMMIVESLGAPRKFI